MRNYHQFYIDGRWVDPVNGGEPYDVINPATEKVAGSIRLGSDADVDAAVAAARKAFPTYSATPLAQRIELMGTIIGEYQKRIDDIAAAVTEETRRSKAARCWSRNRSASAP